MSTERTYDIVIMGATGFTGRLVAEYLLERGPTSLRWAMAGRNEGKLSEVRTELAKLFPQAAEIPLITADSLDPDAMRSLAVQTKVVCTTVGPYAHYGEPLVAACAAEGTNYCDLTGEVQFIRKMIDNHADAAQASGAKIVHCCGFDSIPSDIGVYMLGEAMTERGATLKNVQMFAGESRGTFSGGTVASLLNVLDEAKKDRDLRRVIGHPYGLNPEDERDGPDGKDQQGIAYSKDLGMWTAPFVMAGINTRVVRRTQSLRGHPYGRDFRYSEVMSTGKGTSGLMRATAITGGLGGFLLAASNNTARRFMNARFLPKPGEGPSREARENGFFVLRFVASGQTEAGTTIKLKGKVRGQKDPGYGETAKMIGESAMCLALDESVRA
ncbi:MAG: saccharopine dehydrogenase NADP-binding domain-containing protein, partial [Myxococcota bacterium]